MSYVPFLKCVTLALVSFLSKVQFVQALLHDKPVTFWSFGAWRTCSGRPKVSRVTTERDSSEGSSWERFPFQFLRYFILIPKYFKVENWMKVSSGMTVVLLSMTVNASMNSGFLMALRRSFLKSLVWQVAVTLYARSREQIHTGVTHISVTDVVRGSTRKPLVKSNAKNSLSMHLWAGNYFFKCLF